MHFNIRFEHWQVLGQFHDQQRKHKALNKQILNGLGEE